MVEVVAAPEELHFYTCRPSIQPLSQSSENRKQKTMFFMLQYEPKIQPTSWAASFAVRLSSHDTQSHVSTVNI